MIKVKKLTESAILPQRCTPSDAGLDLFSNETIDIPPGDWVDISTGIAVAIPEGFYGRIAPRSGMAKRSGVQVLAGVIDREFRGEVKVILYNPISQDITKTVHIQIGDRIAQLILESCMICDVCEVDELPVSERGERGFGSSGN